MRAAVSFQPVYDIVAEVMVLSLEFSFMKPAGPYSKNAS